MSSTSSSDHTIEKDYDPFEPEYDPFEPGYNSFLPRIASVRMRVRVRMSNSMSN